MKEIIVLSLLLFQLLGLIGIIIVLFGGIKYGSSLHMMSIGVGIFPWCAAYNMITK